MNIMVISYIKEKKRFPDFDFFGGETRTARTGPTKFWRKVDASATGNDNNRTTTTTDRADDYDRRRMRATTTSAATTTATTTTVSWITQTGKQIRRKSIN